MKKLVEKIPEKIRLVLLTAVFGIAAGLATVAFMQATNYLFALAWHRLGTAGTTWFLVGSLLTIVLSSLAAGLLMSRICPVAAGSGVPQLKSAYWMELGVVPFRAVVVKFIGGVLTLAGGSSLGREGPTVFICGGLCSNVAAWLGIDKQKRRHAALAGAAAGLAAAFNTPLAAVSFILEEILGDLGSRLIGSVVLASVTGAFIVYAFVGRQPSFFMPSVDSCSWGMYLVVPATAALSAFAGVIFQRTCLDLRRRMKHQQAIPGWLQPAMGALVVWCLGSGLFLATGHLGVFGLGYEDLSAAFRDGIAWKIAGLLAVAKLVATIASYGSGGCGGIFSPTLFIGAMCGFFTAGTAACWMPLSPADHLVLAAVGMCGCFSAVVRAPITGILMIFEMTHQFGMVPALMLGTLVSQSVARLAGKQNFYNAILAQDNVAIHKIAPPRDLAAWHTLPVSAFANRNPVAVTTLSPEALRDLLKRYAFRCFPVIMEGELKGVVTRETINHALAHDAPLAWEEAVAVQADRPLAEIEPLLIKSNTGLFAVVNAPGGPITGVFTLHDLLRAQAAVME